LINRPDLRIHRKILIIDRSIAYVGSLNLADPVFFNLNKKVGRWVDAMSRLTGPVVESLITVFLTDWSVETASDYGENEKLTRPTGFPPGKARIQCLASGPAVNASSIEQLIVSAVYLAREEIVMTTPYFIPSEALQYALTSAARRGIRVTLIVPLRMDSRLAQYAGRAFMTELLEAGVHIRLYRGGMLHTKSITIDGRVSFFGSLNLDTRSFRINFEITLLIYDSDFTEKLLALQESYKAGSSRLTLDKERRKTTWNRTKEDIARLLSPLL
ncbi:MAG TPA: phospholipase D-like domain-containing protein, partial [Pseudobdellovibrionaceae bacterium]|nr:phospholipase D-like domain-containing protein [Pseudobdellovibrionaceae bacterium]